MAHYQAVELTRLFRAIGAEIEANKRSHGWKVTGPNDWADQHEVPAALMLITTEVAEAMEAFRNNDRENFAEELADVLIRTIGLSHSMGIDLAEAIYSKMERNRTRTYKHGGKRI
jgi:NTP pyrophosphatase (non-canonical NTP hydrolase)